MRYNGVDDVPRTDKRDGFMDPWHVHLLAEQILDSGYFELEDSYSRNVTDLERVLTTVARHGKRKVVTNYGASGPVQLWATQQLIDSLLPKVTRVDEEIERILKQHGE